MPVTLSGSAGQTGSLTLTDSDLNNTVQISLAGTVSVVTAPTSIPSNSSDSNWTLTGMYATSMYKGSLSLTTSPTTLTWSSISNALCNTGNATNVNVLYVKNLGTNGVRVYWPSVLHSGNTSDTANYTLVPAYGAMELTIPMLGVAVGTTAIKFASDANTTSAYVAIAYKGT